MAKTFQTNIHGGNEHETHNQMTKYSMFVGGLDAKHDALEQFKPLKTGFARIFMIKQPAFLNVFDDYRKKMKIFKHILEYGNVGVQGNNNVTMNFNQYNGGYTNRQLDMPNIAIDDTNELTISVYEYTGSPIREIIQLWMNGVSDLRSGHAHYYGANLPVCPANHTAEFVYATTDPTGLNVEYAAYFTNCFPKEIRFDHFNYEAGNHDVVKLDLIFTCSRHVSPAVNVLANRLVQKYAVIMNSLNYNSGVRSAVSKYLNADGKIEYGTFYDPYTGKLEKIEETGKYGRLYGDAAYWSDHLNKVQSNEYRPWDTIDKTQIIADLRTTDSMVKLHQSIYGNLTGIQETPVSLRKESQFTSNNRDDTGSGGLEHIKPLDDGEYSPVKSSGYRGDADGDGEVTVKDANKIADYLAHGKGTNLSSDADFNGDGKVDVRDAAAIARYMKNGGSNMKGDPSNDGAITYHDAELNAKKLAQGKGSEVNVKQGDFNGDGKVDVRDSAALAKWLRDGGTKIPGDVNNDGKINNSDLTYLSNMITHHKQGELNANADVNGDGEITVRDRAALERMIKP